MRVRRMIRNALAPASKRCRMGLARVRPAASTRLFFLLITLFVLGITMPPAQKARVQQPQCIPPPSGLVAWWPMDETSGTTITDIVGNFHGQANVPIGMSTGGPGPVPSWGGFAPVVNNALGFGAQAHIKVPHDPALDPGSGGFTVDAWVNFTALAAPGVVIIQKWDGNSGWRLSLINPSSPWLSFNVRPASGPLVGTNVPITPGQWHHVAAVIERGTGPGGTDIIRLYIDGAQVGANSGVSLGNISSGADLFIGGDGVMTGRFALDEVEIFDRALSGQEIQAIFQAGSAGKCKPQQPPCINPPANLVAWWPLDEPSGAPSLQDIVGGNQAIPQGNGVQAVTGMVNGAQLFNTPLTLGWAYVSPFADLGSIGSADFSIDAWVRFESLPPSATPANVATWPVDKGAIIVSRLEANQKKGYALYIYSPGGIANNGRLEFLWGDGSTFTKLQTTSPISPGEWHHVTVTFKRLQPGFEVRLYVEERNEENNTAEFQIRFRILVKSEKTD